jgi:hypothetical protein
MLVKYLVNVPPFLEQFQGLLLNIFPKLSLPGLTRVSLGIGNSEEDIDTLIRMLGRIVRQPRNPRQKDIKQQMNDFTRTVAQKVYTKP